MTTERVDIVFTEKGAAKVSTSIKDIAEAAEKTEEQIEETKKALDFSGVAKGVGVAFGAVAAGFALVVRESLSQRKAIAQLNQGLISTNNAVGQSLDELRAKANDLEDVTIFGGDQFIDAQSKLVIFTDVVGEQFDKTIELAADMSVRLGTNLPAATLRLGKALNDPIQGLSSLRESGILFSKSQKDMVRVLVEAGDKIGAQQIILKELEVQFGGSARAARETFGGAIVGLKNSFLNLFEAGNGGFDGLAAEINDFSALLKDPELIASARDLSAALISTFSLTTAAITGTVGAVKFLSEELAAATSGPALGDLVRIGDKLEQLRAKRALLVESSKEERGFFSKLFNDDGGAGIANLDKQIAKLEEMKRISEEAAVEISNISKIKPEIDTSAEDRAQAIVAQNEKLVRQQALLDAIAQEDKILAGEELKRRKDLIAAINEEMEQQAEIARQIQDIERETSSIIEREVAARNSKVNLVRDNVEDPTAQAELIQRINDQSNEYLLSSVISREQMIRNEIQRTSDYTQELLDNNIVITEETNQAIVSRHKELQAELVRARVDAGEGTFTEVLFGSGALERLFSDFDNIEDNFKALVAQILVEAAVLKTVEMFGGDTSGFSSSLGQGFLNSFGGEGAGASRAGGGRISAGQPFNYGERGFETLRLDSGKMVGLSGEPGTVVPTSQLMDSEPSVNNVNINFNGLNTDYGLQRSARASASETKRRLDFG